MMNIKLQNYPWWSYLDESQKDGLKTSFILLVRELEHPTSEIHDYAFLVFPAAKAYEGFLKKFFLDLGLISKFDYRSDHFRIGKALNPSLDREYRHESVYDKLADFCQGKQLPDTLWEAWKNGRNTLFHWWPDGTNILTIDEAKARIEEIVQAIDMAFEECKIQRQVSI